VKYFTGKLEFPPRRLLHVGDTNVRDWMEAKFPALPTYEIKCKTENSAFMGDSGRSHNRVSKIAEDLGFTNLALYLRKNGEKEDDLITFLEKRGYDSIFYINENEAKGCCSWIVWDWSLMDDGGIK
jgi:hypothetical protein